MRVKEPISEMMVGTKRGREAKETLLWSGIVSEDDHLGIELSLVLLSSSKLTNQNNTTPESTTSDPGSPPTAL